MRYEIDMNLCLTFTILYILYINQSNEIMIGYRRPEHIEN